MRSMASVRLTLALQQVLPGGGEGVLEVGHEDLGPRVEGVDHHLAVDRAGDLHPPVLEVGRHRGHAPVALPHGARLGQEVRAHPGVQLPLALRPALQERGAAPAELPLQAGHEGQGVRAQDPGAAGVDRPADLDALTRRDASHGIPPPAGAFPRVRGPRRATAGPLYCPRSSERALRGGTIVLPLGGLCDHRLARLDRPPARRRDYPPGGGAGLRRPAHGRGAGPDQPRSRVPCRSTCSAGTASRRSTIPVPSTVAPSPAQIARAVKAIRWYLAAGHAGGGTQRGRPGPRRPRRDGSGRLSGGRGGQPGGRRRGGAAGLAGSGRGRLPGRRPQRLRHARAPGGRLRR